MLSNRYHKSLRITIFTEEAALLDVETDAGEAVATVVVSRLVSELGAVVKGAEVSLALSVTT